MQKFTLLLATFALFFAGQLQAQCPGCSINLPADIQAVSDTIFVDSVEGTPMKGAYFIDTLNFRLPHTMTPLAALDTSGQIPANAQNAEITRFEITNVIGMPIGLSYVGSRDPLTFTEAPPQTRDGCITICGTPQQSGTFEVTIVVELDLVVSGLSVNDQSSSFPLEIVVLPDTNSTFTKDTTAGCSPLTVNFATEIPSGGDPNFDYFWDFGNGQTSTDEAPPAITYTAPAKSDTSYGIYNRVIVDTFPFILTQVIIDSADCDDLLNDPDMFFKLLNNTGVELYNGDYTTGANPLTERNKAAPDTLPINETLNLLPNQVYTIEVWDHDPTSFLDPQGDDACASVSFSVNSTNFGRDTLTGGGGRVDFTIEHYIDTLETTDSVFVCPECVVPTNLDTLSVVQRVNFPQFGDAELSWTEDGPATEWQVEYGTSGFAQGSGSVISPTGSPTSTIPVIMGNTYDYYVRSICPSGDTTTWVGPFTFDAGTAISVTYVDEIDESLQVYPNPSNGQVNVVFESDQVLQDVQLMVSDMLGRQVYNQTLNYHTGRHHETLSLDNFGEGVYMIQLKVGDSMLHRKVIVSK